MMGLYEQSKESGSTNKNKKFYRKRENKGQPAEQSKKFCKHCKFVEIGNENTFNKSDCYLLKAKKAVAKALLESSWKIVGAAPKSALQKN